MNQVFSLQPRGPWSGGLARAVFILNLAFATAATQSSQSPPAQPRSAQSRQAPPIANFTDVAEKAGLTVPTVFGGKETKKYIIETTGTGVAIFDYDNDGW